MMQKKVLKNIIHYNDCWFRNCFYQQLVAAYGAFGIPADYVVCNYTIDIDFSDDNETLDIREHEILDEETAAEVAKESRRGPFRFSKYGIPQNAELVFINDASVVVKVIDDRHIAYKGVTTSLSALAQQLLEYDYQVQGTAYFSYQGEKLTDLRERMESKK